MGSNYLFLPLVESVIRAYNGPSFERVKIIGVQHILETTHAMFRSLYKLGLKPENVSIMGKCYSTCKEVYEEMQEDGIDVSPASFSYNSHEAFDQLFDREIHHFIQSRALNLLHGDYDCVIILDDGGHCIRYFMEFLKQESQRVSVPVVAVEQTSSGYEAIRSDRLPFPVINVARSPVKLELESPMIAQAAAERLSQSLQKRGLFFQEALILGAGPIGQSIKGHLSPTMNIVMYDQNKSVSDYPGDLSDIIHRFPLIIGCTGKTSLPRQMHTLLAPGAVLVSASSSDREFDACHLRKLLPQTQEWSSDLMIENHLLIKHGFPVNFDNERENIEPARIQLTIALIAAGIIQARDSSLSVGIVALSTNFEEKIRREFLLSNTDAER